MVVILTLVLIGVVVGLYFANKNRTTRQKRVEADNSNVGHTKDDPVKDKPDEMPQVEPHEDKLTGFDSSGETESSDKDTEKK